MEQNQPHMPPTPEGRKPQPEQPHPEKGLFERWLKRDKKPAEKPEKLAANPKPDKAEVKEPERPKTRAQKFGEGLLRLLRGEKQESKPPTEPSGEPAKQSAEPATAEAEPAVEQAGRVRRFAKVVLGAVLGAAEGEHELANRTRQKPLDTEPLMDAADDLRGAVDDLEQAMPVVKTAKETAPKTPDQSTFGSESVGAGAPDFDSYTPPELSTLHEALLPAVEARVAERVQQRLQQLEEKLEVEQDKNKLAAAAATAGMGIFAVASVLLLGHEYLAHKKIKKEQKHIKKQLQEQQQEQEVQFAQLKQERATDLTRRDRQAYYERLSAFTHQQAETTREATRELKQTQAQPKPIPVVPVLPIAETSADIAPRRRELHESAPRRNAERVSLPAETPEALPPLTVVETADTVELGPSQPSYNGKSQPQAGGAGFGTQAMQQVPVGHVPGDQDIVKAPLSAAAQRQLAARKARLQANAWLYGALLAVTIVIVVIAIVIIG